METSSTRSDSAESNQVNKKYELEDVMVYKLASRLGGRNEVVDLPIVEALAYIIIQLEEEEEAVKQRQWDLYLNHLSRVQANPAQDKDDAKMKGEFMESLNPAQKIEHKPIEKEWNFDQLEKLKSLQN
ncbi:hypothetical protein [Macrococcus animalis]|uniref:hypothetical protein n=1 Tax=Macrococcus animalis TaxID=3395467 RepID=UPI0039BE77C4